MHRNTHDAVAAVTLAIVWAVWLAAIGVAGEDYVALMKASVTARSLR